MRCCKFLRGGLFIIKTVCLIGEKTVPMERIQKRYNTTRGMRQSYDKGTGMKSEEFLSDICKAELKALSRDALKGSITTRTKVRKPHDRIKGVGQRSHETEEGQSIQLTAPATTISAR